MDNDIDVYEKRAKKGEFYYGWRELKEATGVSKHLYNKYYLKGINPTFRINTDGPVPREAI